MTLIFKVTEVTKVKFGFQSITPKVLELSTWNLVQTLIVGGERSLFILGSLGSFLGQPVNFGVTRGQFWGSLEHNSKIFKAINLKPGRDSWLGSSKMSTEILLGCARCTITQILNAITQLVSSTAWPFTQKYLLSRNVRMVMRNDYMYRNNMDNSKLCINGCHSNKWDPWHQAKLFFLIFSDIISNICRHCVA